MPAPLKLAAAMAVVVLGLLPGAACAAVASTGVLPAASSASGTANIAGAAGLEQHSRGASHGAVERRFERAAIASAYVDYVHAAYSRAHRAATGLSAAIDRLLATPGPQTLQAAREAWLQARRPYLATEAFRFYDGPIDGPETPARPAGPEGRLNAWPLNEAVIDYVDGAPRSGLVHALDVPMSRETILARDQVSDEADVTTGWHAIEFLLWGQDVSDEGPGARTAEDYAPGTVEVDRRRRYLTLLADLLVDDLALLEAQWERDRPASYAQEFLALDPDEALSRMLTGAALLAGHELASERLAVGLDSGAQEDEQSCFSDSTWQDFAWGLAGIKGVYYGEHAADARAGTAATRRGAQGPQGSHGDSAGDRTAGTGHGHAHDHAPDEASSSASGVEASIAAALRHSDARLAAEIDRRFARAERAVAQLHDPFDRILVAPPDSPLRADAEAAVLALQELAASLRDAGAALGVQVTITGA